MKRNDVVLAFFGLVLGAALSSCGDGSSLPADGDSRIFDHVHATRSALTALSDADILLAKDALHIGYGHTSHGSQITDGLNSLDAFMGGTGLYSTNSSGAGGALHLYEGDGYGSGDLDHDAGYYPDWTAETEAFLGPANSDGRGAAHPEFNVIMWSWCGQLSSRSAEDVRTQYLEPMAEFEAEYPGIAFVYMTGHADGSGLEGALHWNNQIIRAWCAERGSWLFDFYDIECYDSDGVYYGDKHVTDACDYEDETGTGPVTRNWALEWQDSHPGEWYECGAEHSQPVNSNRKAYAAWNLFAALARDMQ